LFVAQFIGSPPMNIVKGELIGSDFMANGEKVAVPVKGKVAKAILGVRPEDCSITSPAKGALKAQVYTTELIGDHTLVTTKIGSDTLTVKASKDYTANSGDKIGISFEKSRVYVFDADGGARVR
jgi:multiple sugar transport system ATP-binding protein